MGGWEWKVDIGIKRNFLGPLNFVSIITPSSSNWKIKVEKSCFVKYCRLYIRPIYDFPKPLSLNETQEAKLKVAFLKELVRIASENLTSSLENVKTDLKVKMEKGIPHKTLSNKVETLEKRIACVGYNLEKWFKNSNVYQLNLINWMAIAQKVFPSHDGDSLRRWWKCHLDPNFLRGDLNVTEINLLKNLTRDCNPKMALILKVLPPKSRSN